MKIAVDLDDVMLDFSRGVVHCFETEFGELLGYDGEPWGESFQTLRDHPKLKAAGYKNWWGWLRERDWLWATFPAIDGAIGGVATLRAQGHYVECVTSKPKWAEPQVYRWLGKWRPPFQRITIVNSGQRKIDYTDADIIVDDKLETCEEFGDAGRLALQFSRAGFKGSRSSRVEWAKNWQQVVSSVSRIEKGAPLS